MTSLYCFSSEVSVRSIGVQQATIGCNRQGSRKFLVALKVAKFQSVFFKITILSCFMGFFLRTLGTSWTQCSDISYFLKGGFFFDNFDQLDDFFFLFDHFWDAFDLDTFQKKKNSRIKQKLKYTPRFSHLCLNPNLVKVRRLENQERTLVSPAEVWTEIQLSLCK